MTKNSPTVSRGYVEDLDIAKEAAKPKPKKAAAKPKKEAKK